MDGSEASRDGTSHTGDSDASSTDTSDGNTQPPLLEAGPPCRVFVTSTTIRSNFGGVTGADNRCTSLATAAKLGGNWIAWLSGPSRNAIDRISHPGPFVLVDGRPLAADRAALGKVAIDVTEHKTTASGVGLVWTGTLPNGAASGLDCRGWSSAANADKATVGSVASGSKWTDSFDGLGANCDSSGLRLYCFEQ
jgi:hypothetical protein